MDLDSSEDLEAGLVGVVHEEETHAGVVAEVSQTDVLLVAAKIYETDEARVDDTDETFGAAAMLYVGPTGLADGGHVEAVAALEEVLFCGSEGVSGRGGLFDALVLAPAAVFLLLFFDAWSEGQFLEATTHRVLDPGRWTRCLLDRLRERGGGFRIVLLREL
jgi:hypothetical protein